MFTSRQAVIRDKRSRDNESRLYLPLMLRHPYSSPPADSKFFSGRVANCVDLDHTSHSTSSDLGLHCLLKPVCPNT